MTSGDSLTVVIANNMIYRLKVALFAQDLHGRLTSQLSNHDKKEFNKLLESGILS